MQNASTYEAGRGSAYIFERNSVSGQWKEVQKIVASDRDFDDFFGWSVSISGNKAIVGAYHEDHDTTGTRYLESSGSAYIFKISPSTSVTPTLQAESLKLYPNPAMAGGNITLALPAGATTANVEVVDARGRSISQQAVSGSRAVLAAPLSAGVYTVKLHTASGTAVGRVVVR